MNIYLQTLISAIIAVPFLKSGNKNLGFRQMPLIYSICVMLMLTVMYTDSDEGGIRIRCKGLPPDTTHIWLQRALRKKHFNLVHVPDTSSVPVSPCWQCAVLVQDQNAI